CHRRARGRPLHDRDRPTPREGGLADQPPEGGPEMNKRLAAIAILLAAIAAAAGLFASPSQSAAQPTDCGHGDRFNCLVLLTGSGPSPARVQMTVFTWVHFKNTDSVAHTVVFANGLCTLTVDPFNQPEPFGPSCPSDFMTFAGSYAYTVDGKYPGLVVTSLVPRSVSLTARTHMIRSGTRLTLHGQVMRSDSGTAPPPPVVVLPRHTPPQP